MAGKMVIWGYKVSYGLKIHTIVISDAVMYKAAYENQLM